METPPRRIGLEDMDAARYAASGSLFILAVDSCLYPLDTAKTIVMSERAAHFRPQRLPAIIWNIARREGVLRFWRGLAPSVVGSFPGQAAYFFTYESAQSLSEFLAPSGAAPPSSFQTFSRGFIAGATAEFAGGAFYVPADVVAQRLQVQSLRSFAHNKRLFSGPIDVARKVLKNDGIRGFYRGYLAYVTAYAPGSAVQWGSYELFKTLLYRTVRLLESRHGPSDRPSHPFRDSIINGVSGGMAAACAIMANNPLEVLRIRTQLLDSRNRKDAEHIQKGYFRLGAHIFREEGWRAFYRGLHIRFIVSIPSAMIAMSGYETIKMWSSFDAAT